MARTKPQWSPEVLWRSPPAQAQKRGQGHPFAVIARRVDTVFMTPERAAYQEEALSGKPHPWSDVCGLHICWQTRHCILLHEEEASLTTGHACCVKAAVDLSSQPRKSHRARNGGPQLLDKLNGSPHRFPPCELGLYVRFICSPHAC